MSGVIAAGVLMTGQAAAAVPDRVWATYIGGEKTDQAYGVAVDGVGDIYVAGLTVSIAGIATPGAFRTQPVGVDCFLIKFSPAGVRLWGTYFGGTGDDQCESVRTGPGGVVVGGGTTSDGIATMGAFQGVKAASKDGFVAKFTGDGMLAWSTYIGGGGSNDSVLDAAIGAQGEVYVVGRLVAPAAVTTMGAHQPDYGGGGSDGFLARFDPAGAMVWGTYYGGLQNDRVDAVTLGAAGEIYIAGTSNSTQGIASPGAHQEALSGASQDLFLARFDDEGVRAWGTYYGGASVEQAARAAALPGGVVLGGITQSTGMATPGSHQEAFGGGFDGLLARFDDQGARVWSTYVGGQSDDYIQAIAADPLGSIYIGGATSSPGGIATVDGFQPGLAGSTDAYAAKFDGAGARRWGTYFGSPAGDSARGMAVDGVDRVLLSGFTFAMQGFATPGADDEIYGGGGFEDGFLAAFTQGLGTACDADQACESGACVDGLCCDSPCGGNSPGDCQACSAAMGAAVDGVCSPLAGDAVCRPAAGECDVAESCDGVDGLCPADLYADEGQACVDGVCMAGVCAPEVGSSSSAESSTGAGEMSTGEATSGGETSGTEGGETTGGEAPTTGSGSSPTATTGGEASTSGEAPTTGGETPTTGGEASTGGVDTDSSTGGGMQDDPGGCGCATPDGSGTGGLLIMLASLVRRRRR